MGALLVGSVWNDSAVMDELAHIPAGFGYISQRDYRLNPEHPPLVKLLAGASLLLAVHPFFPVDTPYWTTEVNGQWGQGGAFVYGSGNDADRIIFWARMPLILLALLFGYTLFRWALARAGPKTALFTLAFYCLSPTVLAHARYVTTDLAASFGIFAGLLTFAVFVGLPSWRNVFIAGLALGAALLTKFSALLLLPSYALILLLWALTYKLNSGYLRSVRERILKGIVVGAISVLMVTGTYAAFIWNYPIKKHLQDAETLLISNPLRSLADLDLRLIAYPATRPLGHFFLGALMTYERVTDAKASTFFLGTITDGGLPFYFPLLYIVKEALAFHILSAIALIYAIRMVGAATWKHSSRLIASIRSWIRNHFIECVFFIFIAFYGYLSVRASLNIGVRHLLPILPLLYFLVARALSLLLQNEHPTYSSPLTLMSAVFKPRAHIFTSLLFFALLLETMYAYPYYLSFYNLLGGGVKTGHTIAVDSNYDWGQDLKRLAGYMDDNHISKITLDYFGGGNIHYYLGNRAQPWEAEKGRARGNFAISATRLGFYAPLKGYSQGPEAPYAWLRPYDPIARAGSSIFIYVLPQ